MAKICVTGVRPTSNLFVILILQQLFFIFFNLHSGIDMELPYHETIWLQSFNSKLDK